MLETTSIYLVTTRRRNYWDRYAEPADVVEYFKDHEYIGFDTETSSMSFMTGELLCIQFGDERAQFVIDLDGIDIDEFSPLFQKILVLQNATFDLPFLYDKGYVPQVYDTLLAEKNLTLGLLVNRGLGDLVKRYCGVEMDKSMQKEISQGLTSKEAIEYAGLDVKYLIPIMEAQVKQAKKEKVINAVHLDCRFARVAAYMEFCGMYADRDALDKLVRHNEAYEYFAEKALKDWIEENQPELYDENFNWGSSQQVIELLAKMGIEAIDPKTKRPTANMKELGKLPKHPLLDLYIDYSKKRKAVTTYGRNWYDYILSDDRIHTKFNVLVDTGRTSCGNVRMGPFPNIQNATRPSKDSISIRSIFKAKGQNVIIACDYSGQESVVLADMSKESNLLNFYKSGSGDLHSHVTKLLFPDETAGVDESDIAEKFPELRQLSKAGTFAIAYGGTGYTISQNLNVPREVGDRVYEAYMKAFPGLSNFFDANFADTLNRGYIRVNLVTGRKRKVENLQRMVKGRDSKMLSHVNRLSTNTKIQGTSADISKTAAVLFFEWVIENKLFKIVQIVNFVHDEIVVECHTRRAEKIATVLQEKMELAGSYFLDTLTLKAEPKIAKIWSK